MFGIGVQTVLSLAAAQASTAPVPPAPLGPPLWHELRVGMTPEEVADQLKSIEGVKSVLVKRGKRRPVELSISYTASGVLVGTWRVTITPIFEAERLSEITLSNLSCRTGALEQAKLVSSTLRERLGHSQTERVVDEHGVTIDRRMAFWDDKTRARLSVEEVAPPSDEEVYANGAVGGALAALANLGASLSRDDIMKACPSDLGYRLQSTINYSAQSAFLAAQAEAAAKDEANRKATRDNL